MKRDLFEEIKEGFDFLERERNANAESSRKQAEKPDDKPGHPDNKQS
jgi:hypothetical protein